MIVKSGQTWTGMFSTKDSTGALATPSVGPAGVLYVDGTANGATVTISGSNPYKWTVTLPSLTAGQTVSMYITATISSIATSSVVAEAIGDTARLSDTLTANSASGGITSSSFVSGAITAASIAADAIGASELAADAVAEIQSGLATSASISALNNLSQADIRTAVGLASANLDTQFDDLAALLNSGIYSYSDTFF